MLYRNTIQGVAVQYKISTNQFDNGKANIEIILNYFLIFKDIIFMALYFSKLKNCSFTMADLYFNLFHRTLNNVP